LSIGSGIAIGSAAIAASIIAKELIENNNNTEVNKHRLELQSREKHKSKITKKKNNTYVKKPKKKKNTSVKKPKKKR